MESPAIVWRALAGRCSADCAPPARSCRAGRRPPPLSPRAGAGRFPLLPAGGRVPSLRPRGGDGAGWGAGAAPPPAGVGGAVAGPAARPCTARPAPGARGPSETPSLRSGARGAGAQNQAGSVCCGDAWPGTPPPPAERSPSLADSCRRTRGVFTPTLSLLSLPPLHSAFLPPSLLVTSLSRFPSVCPFSVFPSPVSLFCVSLFPASLSISVCSLSVSSLSPFSSVYFLSPFPPSLSRLPRPVPALGARRGLLGTKPVLLGLGGFLDQRPHIRQHFARARAHTHTIHRAVLGICWRFPFLPCHRGACFGKVYHLPWALSLSCGERGTY